MSGKAEIYGTSENKQAGWVMNGGAGKWVITTTAQQHASGHTVHAHTYTARCHWSACGVIYRQTNMHTY